MLLFRYVRYLLQARDEHAIHSPFVFELYTEVIRSSGQYYVYPEIECSRKEMLASQESIEVVDLGAGSRMQSGLLRNVSSIARHAQKPAKFGQLLFRLVHFFSPKIIVDLGTSLGITTLYLAAASQQSKVYTFEGCPATARIAQRNFDSMGTPHIHLVEGNLNNTLQAEVNKLERIDFAFFDANHRYQPTIAYFETCLSKSCEQSVFVFDDIYWSAEMEQAWRYICQHPRVTLTIDLFHVGLVFFRTNQPKQHFTLRF